ncbi:carbohydrate ABC transporter permease [Plantibacter sp. Mn2098]|uniref:carbohydrate ABC transporter permease n=1 Tax=Plantibacter sp. Mn2098 TaxID=3395266 RepID=UPI003BC42779
MTTSTLQRTPRATINRTADQNRRRKRFAPYMLLIPAIAILLFGLGYPVIWQIVTSFQKYGALQQLGGQAAPFVGFDNYIAVATNPEFWGVVVRSLVFCIATAFITLAIGMLFALLMTVIGKAARLTLQIGLLLAWAMPVVAATTVWIWLFDRRRGAINYLLDMIPGVNMNRFDWIGTPSTFFIVASVIVIWMSVPFVAFSAYAALTQVSEEVLEAAALDGASGWKRFTNIIFPTIRPVVSIVLLLQLIWDLRVFTQITLLQDAGSKGSDFDLLGTYIYKSGVAGLDFGQGSAMALFVLALTIALSWFYIRSLLKEDKQS